jgi:hypothetical protein
MLNNCILMPGGARSCEAEGDRNEGVSVEPHSCNCNLGEIQNGCGVSSDLASDSESIYVHRTSCPM